MKEDQIPQRIPPPSFRLPPSWGLGRLGRLIRKELSEILRDRRTILTLVLMPLLLYPLLSIAFRQFFLASGLTAPKEIHYRLGFHSGEEAILVYQQMEKGATALAERAKQGAPEAEHLPRVERPFLGADLEGNLKKHALDLIVVVRNAAQAPLREIRGRGGALQGLQVTQDTALDCDLIYLKESARSLEALDYVERLLAAANAAYLQGRLGLPEVQPKAVLMRVTAEGVSDPEQNSLVSLSALVPLILILMTITGAVYPAIDLTAGERERGTLEILVAAPVPRLGLLFAKYVSVVTVAVLTALVNLVTMVSTVLLSGLGPMLFRGQGLTPLLALEIFGLLLLFAAFFSAVLLMLTSFARSFKEAQAYLIPLMLASLGPGLLGMLPGLRLSGVLTVTPLVNIVLLARDLLNNETRPGPAALVVCSTLLYALAAIAGAARIFGAEGVLYSEQSSWSDLFRRPAAPQPVPTPAAALMCLALMFPTYFVLQSLLVRAEVSGLDLAGQAAMRLGLLTGVSALLFGLFPVVSARLRRVSLRTGLLLLPARWPAYLGGLVLGVSLWPLLLELLAGLHAWGVTTLTEGQAEQVLGSLRSLRVELPPWMLVAALAVPAPFEELFFRGYLFSALRARTNGLTTVVVSALLFGLFHVLLMTSLGFERLLPTTLLGLVLGWVCLKSGSVFPGMLLHTCHNALTYALLYFQPEPSRPAGGEVEATYLPVLWLIGSAAGIALGVALILWGRVSPQLRRGSQNRAGGAAARGSANRG